jgi:ubiquinone biosynthesis protein Coq4
MPEPIETLAGRTPDLTAVETAARAAHAGDQEAGRTLAAAFLHAAFAAPELIAPVWDAAARGWTGTPDEGPAIALPPVLPSAPPPALWPDVQALLEDAAAGRLDPLAITARTAALAAHLDAAFTARLAAACAAFPGVREAAADGIPPRFTMEELALAPEGSLGEAFHRQIADNGYELEVLDREALGLADLPHPLGYVNARILQLHDLIHLAAGYELTALHEIGISGFQMGQFGHHYSAMFLAVVTTLSATSPQPGALAVLLDVTLAAWRHGRRTPPLLGLDWKGLWHLPLPEFRKAAGITPFASPWPPRLFEEMRAAA